MPDEPTPGSAIATRRAVMDIVRAATLGSYGVVGFRAPLWERVAAALGGRPAGLRVRVRENGLEIDLRLAVAAGLPVAEVARQVDSAIRHGIRRALGREVGRLSIRVAGLASDVGTPPPTPRPEAGDTRPSDLADSGTDVA